MRKRSAAKCAKWTDMFWAVAGPSSAPVADDSGAGVGYSDMHSEEETLGGEGQR